MSDIRFRSEIEADAAAKEQAKWKCDCGADYFEAVSVVGYPSWHRSNGRIVRYLDECAAPNCGKKVCHACSVKCAICGETYCPQHSSAPMTANKLCDGCMGLYPQILVGPQRAKLIEIEARLHEYSYQCQGYYRAYGMRQDMERLLEIAKNALMDGGRR